MVPEQVWGLPGLPWVTDVVTVPEVEDPQMVRCGPGICLVADTEVGSVPREPPC